MITKKINDMYENDVKKTKDEHKRDLYKQMNIAKTDQVNIFRHMQKAMIEEIQNEKYSNFDDYQIFSVFDIFVNNKNIMKKEADVQELTNKNILAFFLYSELSNFYMESYFKFLKKNNIKFIEEVLAIKSQALNTLISENFHKLLTMLMINNEESIKGETIAYINKNKKECIKLLNFLYELATVDIEIELQDVLEISIKEAIRALPKSVQPQNLAGLDKKNIYKYNHGKYATIVKSLLDEYALFTCPDIDEDICSLYKQVILVLYKNKDKFNIVNTIRYQLHQDPINLASINVVLEQIENEVNTLEQVVNLSDYIISKMIKRNVGEIDYMPQYKISLSTLCSVDNHSYVNGVELVFIDRLFKKFITMLNHTDLVFYKLSDITKEEINVLISLSKVQNMRIVKEQMIKISQLIFNDYFNSERSEVETIFNYKSNLDYNKIDKLEKDEQMFLNVLYTNNHSQKDSVDLNLRNRTGHGVMYDNSYTELLISYIGLIKSLKVVL